MKNPLFFFWSCTKSQQVATRTPRKKVFFDIDETLIVIPCEFNNFGENFATAFPHLTLVEDFEYRLYLINKEKTAQLFQELMKMEDVDIAFCTAGSHPRTILKVFEREYALPAGSLEKCLYINRCSKMLKGHKLKKLVRQGKLTSEDFVLLVDDQERQLVSVRNHKSQNFSAIHATGFFYFLGENEHIYVHYNDDYLEKILTTVKETKLNHSPQIPSDTPPAQALVPRML